jgi:hypothetical protein
MSCCLWWVNVLHQLITQPHQTPHPMHCKRVVFTMPMTVCFIAALPFTVLPFYQTRAAVPPTKEPNKAHTAVKGLTQGSSSTWLLLSNVKLVHLPMLDVRCCSHQPRCFKHPGRTAPTATSFWSTPGRESTAAVAWGCMKCCLLKVRAKQARQPHQMPPLMCTACRQDDTMSSHKCCMAAR